MEGQVDAEYHAWEMSVPPQITGDRLWNVRVYRLALYAARLGWDDVTKLVRDQRARVLSEQLYRALGSISANIAEGYSRRPGKDRARFYEYALGSARESRDWYYKGQPILGAEVTDRRLTLLTHIVRLLLRMVPDQRNRALHEELPVYDLTDTEATH